jgi:hypothetical protein
MQKSVPMRVFQSQSALPNHFTGDPDIRASVDLDPVRQVVAFKQFGHVIGDAVNFTRVGGADDMRMIQLPDRGHFLHKAFDQFAGVACLLSDKLDGELFAKHLMLGMIHNTHPAAAESAAELIIVTNDTGKIGLSQVFSVERANRAGRRVRLKNHRSAFIAEGLVADTLGNDR